MKINRYYLLVAFGILSISFSPIITRMSNSDSIVIAANRMLYTVILITPFTIKHVSTEIKNISKKNIFLNILSGLFLGFHFWAWIDALQYTSIANATILVNLHPIFILLLGYFFLNQKIDFISIISTIIAILGSFIIIYNTLFNLNLNIHGDLMAIIGAIAISVYLTIGSQIRKSISNKTYTYISYFTAFITLFIISFFINTNIFLYPTSDIFVFLGLAIVPTLLGHSIFNYSLKHLSAHFISIAVLGEPVLATIWAFVFFNELITIYQFIGGLIIIIGIGTKIKYSK